MCTHGYINYTNQSIYGVTFRRMIFSIMQLYFNSESTDMLIFVFGAKREKFLKKLFYVSSDYNISTYEKQQIIPKQANSGLKVFQASANTKPPEVHFKGTICFFLK